MDQKRINEIMERAKNDKRSANEIFQSIAKLLIEEHNVPEEKAIEATRNLTGLYEGILEIAPQEGEPSEEPLKNLDDYLSK